MQESSASSSSSEGVLADISALSFDAQGLLPAIVQDALTGENLMLAYVSRESLERTLASGETWFWSRSRRRLWHKGEESGHTQKVVEIRLDCDGDTLLIRVRPSGPACHTGSRHCFYRRLAGSPEMPEEQLQSAERLRAVLAELGELIHLRRRQLPENSYTAYLFRQGLDKILKKIGEEAAEVIIASKNEEPERLVSEVADLLFHLLVLAEERGLSAAAVAAELEKRRK